MILDCGYVNFIKNFSNKCKSKNQLIHNKNNRKWNLVQHYWLYSQVQPSCKLNALLKNQPNHPQQVFSRYNTVLLKSQKTQIQQNPTQKQVIYSINDNNQLDSDLRGLNNFANVGNLNGLLGNLANLKASGASSGNVIVGNGNLISGNNNSVEGNINGVSGNGNAAVGNSNVSLGNKNIVSGSQNSVIGSLVTVVGNANLASGNQNVIKGSQNTAAGNNNIA